MAKQDCIMLFPEVETTTKKLTDEQFGILIRAVIAYRLRGEEYGGDDAAVDVAFQFMSNQVDRSEALKTARSNAASKRWENQPDTDAMKAESKTCKPMQIDANGMQRDTPIQSYPIQSNPILDNESKADMPPAPTKQAKKPHGEFGWVKLTDDEYNRLINDLGEAEVKRCIAYVDESAQATGNKNKWRDWNLVVRKCNRDGWGRGGQGYAKKQVPMGASGKLGSAELEAIQRVLKAGE